MYQTLMEKKKEKEMCIVPTDSKRRDFPQKKTKPSIATGRSDENLSELSRRAASLRLNCCIAGGGERRCRRGEGRGSKRSVSRGR